MTVIAEGVSVPEVWTTGSPLVTCRGQSITLHCRSAQGTSVQYSWYAGARGADVLLRSGPELPLRCPSLPPDGRVVCAAHNAVSREHSTPVFLRVLKTGQEEDCVYTVTSEGLESYDCWITTQPPPTTSTTSEETSHPAARTLTSGDGNQTPHGNQTFNGNIFLRSWSGVPVWYDVIRWCLFTAMIATIGLVHMYTAVTLR
ncbi:uncharacterized protein LOC143484956 [Brachyhypopomus gauderio]|uniref:uncharacterized protein LOC143484956 n=1 Tax=Brachyhypopomus gauderio TaxID=698409 RepID=UPI004040F84E